MHILEQLLLVLGLSMDGFAASVCMGMAAGGRRIGPIVAIMSGFHVGMLLLGYAVGAGLPDRLTAMYPWAAGLLLAAMGLKMLIEARAPEEEPRAGQTAGSTVGAALGGRVGKSRRRAARTAGGAILCLLGLKMLLEAMGVLRF